jgi:thiaminase
LDTVTIQLREITEEVKILARSEHRYVDQDDLILPKQIEPIEINYDKFKEQLDQALDSASSSIGWVELCNLRKDLCSKMNISREQFYHSFEEVVSNNYDKYELSTGGEEGVQLRGMVHGFVRCI